MITVAVVILNWNGKKFLQQFLPVLIERTPEAQIIVADNASTDGSIDFMLENFPTVQLIQLDKNYGFAGGYNKALFQIDAEYYVLINSDIEVEKDWLSPLLQLMEQDKNTAACQPKILDFYKREQFEYAGASGGFIDYLGFPFCRGRVFSTFETDHGQYDDSVSVFWATGACLMVRAKIFRELGGLDSDFFAHMEEIDFCWRLHNSGFDVKVVPQSKVYHIGGGTLPKSSSKKTYLNFRNNYILLYKNLPSEKIFPVLTFRLFFDWLAAAKFISDGNFADSIAVFKAQLHTYFFFNKHKHKRKGNIQKTHQLIYKKSIVLEYYLKKKKYYSNLIQNRLS